VRENQDRAYLIIDIFLYRTSDSYRL